MPERNPEPGFPPAKREREPYRLPPLPLLLMEIWRQSWELCPLPPLGRENLKFVFLFCFYHQSPRRATKISHKNTCLLKPRPKLPRRSTIYLYHAAGLEGLSQHLHRETKELTPATVYWYSHHWDSGEDCFSLPGELESEGRVLLLFRQLSGWLVSSWTASPAVPPSPLLSQSHIGHSVLVSYDPTQTQVHSELDPLSTLGKSESFLHVLNLDLRKLRKFWMGWPKLWMCKLMSCWKMGRYFIFKSRK